jgi:hypothetical protein
MNTLITLGIILFPLLIFFGIAGLIIWLIVKRVQEKENETFEKRDN